MLAGRRRGRKRPGAGGGRSRGVCRVAVDALRNVAPTVVSATAIAYAPLTEELAAAYADGRVLLH
mgnify:FL=1